MSTKFKRCLTTVEQYLATLSELLQTPTLDEGSSDDEKQMYEKAKSIVDDIEGELGSEIAKLRKKAAETDPDKQTYGPKMIANIQHLGTLFDGLCEKSESVKQHILPKYERIKQAQQEKQKQEEEERKRNEEEQRKRNEEALRQQLQRQEEYAKKKQEEEEKRRKEMARMVEEQKKIEQEQAAKRQEEERQREDRKKQEREEQVRRAKEKLEQETKYENEARKRKAEEMMHKRQPQEQAQQQQKSGYSDSSLPVGFHFGQVNDVQSADQYSEALEAAGRQKLVMVTDWFAPWCGPCQMISQTVHEFAERFRNVLFLKVNCDNQTQLASFHQVRSYPTFFVHVMDQLHKRMSGADAKQLQDLITEAESVLEEKMLAEAVQMSLEEEEDGNMTSGDNSNHSASASSTGYNHTFTSQTKGKDGTFASVTRCLENLRQNISTKQFHDVTKILLQYVSNLSKDPAEPKYRKIKTTNKVFQQRVAPFHDAQDILRTAGFEEQNGAYCFGIDPSTGDRKAITKDALETLNTVRDALAKYKDGATSEDPFSLLERLTNEEDRERRR